MRLSPDALARLPADIARSTYDRSQAAGVVHLGVGAFHRTHQAAYLDDLMQAGETGWMIRGASLRSAGVARQLNPQDGLYTLVVRDGGGDRRRVVRSLREVLVAPDDPTQLVAALAAPETRLVTLTVTEKGYRLDPESGALREDDADVRADIADIARPRTAPGLLVAGLAARRDAGRGPLTILSCDNLPENGARTRAAVLALARRVDPALADWIAAEAAFPSCMVDRIVPATTDADVAALETAAGYRDAAMVKTEPFTQWVVEDAFTGARPPLERVGVQMTRDVAGWERAKLRLLNGAHSALAYLGALAGFDFVDQAMRAPGFAPLIDALWDEAQSTLAPVDGFDPRAYRAALAERFLNPALEHRLVQIAMDGSQKLPQRLLAPLRARLAADRPAPAIEFAVAAWMRWQFGEDERGRSFVVDDPSADATRAAVRAGGGDPAATVRALLSIRSVFGEDLAENDALSARLGARLAALTRDGAARAVRDFPGDVES